MRLLRTTLVQTLPLLLALGAVARGEPPAPEDSPRADACSARVVFVLEPNGLEALRRIFADHAERLRQTGVWGPDAEARGLPRLLLRLAPGQCADLVWTRTAEAGASPGTQYVLVAGSPWYELGARESLAHLLVRIGPVEPAPRLADAVSVAATGLGDPPAAVVLVTAAGAEDGSRLGEDDAVAVLERYGVPLQVWTLDAEPGAPGWTGEGVERVEIAGWEDLQRAVDSLRELVESAP